MNRPSSLNEVQFPQRANQIVTTNPSLITNNYLSEKQTGSQLRSNAISDCPDIYARYFCLNGATCFTLSKGNTSFFNCWCPVGFHGVRCDYKYVSRQQSLGEVTNQQHDDRFNEQFVEAADFETYGKLGISSALEPSHNIQSKGNQPAEQQVSYHDQSGQVAKFIHSPLAFYLFLSILAIVLVFILFRLLKFKSGLLEVASLDTASKKNSDNPTGNENPISSCCCCYCNCSSRQTPAVPAPPTTGILSKLLNLQWLRHRLNHRFLVQNQQVATRWNAKGIAARRQLEQSDINNYNDNNSNNDNDNVIIHRPVKVEAKDELYWTRGPTSGQLLLTKGTSSATYSPARMSLDYTTTTKLNSQQSGYTNNRTNLEGSGDFVIPPTHPLPGYPRLSGRTVEAGTNCRPLPVGLTSERRSLVAATGPGKAGHLQSKLEACCSASQHLAGRHMGRAAVSSNERAIWFINKSSESKWQLDMKSRLVASHRMQMDSMAQSCELGEPGEASQPASQATHKSSSSK